MTLTTKLILLASLLLGAWLGAEFWEARIRLDERNLVTQKLDAAWQERLRNTEQVAQGQLSIERDQHAKNVQGIRRQLNSALGQLRERKSRTEQTVAASATCPAVPACTGDRLAREDAEFLERYAAGAAVVKSELAEATAGFETCRKALSDVTKGTQ